MKNKLFLLVLLIAVVALGAGLYKYRNSSFTLDSNKLPVTTSFYPMYFFSSEIGKSLSDVYNITPAGAEPHDYEPTAKDIARIENSKLLVLNGGGLEAWADKITNELKGKNITAVIAGAGITNRILEENGKKDTDPHVWLSPPLAKKEVQRIMEGYIKTDPSHKADYQNNMTALNSRLDQLDTKYRQGLAKCKDKNFVTSHAAFGYLASTYGLNQIPIAGLSPDAEPSPKQLADIVQFVKDHNVKYIFFESLVSPKLSETIANEVGAKTMVLDPIEGITKEDMQSGKNYFTIMDTNLNNLRTALQCE